MANGCSSTRKWSHRLCPTAISAARGLMGYTTTKTAIQSERSRLSQINMTSERGFLLEQNYLSKGPFQVPWFLGGYVPLIHEAILQISSFNVLFKMTKMWAQREREKERKREREKERERERERDQKTSLLFTSRTNHSS